MRPGYINFKGDLVQEILNWEERNFPAPYYSYSRITGVWYRKGKGIGAFQVPPHEVPPLYRAKLLLLL